MSDTRITKQKSPADEVITRSNALEPNTPENANEKIPSAPRLSLNTNADNPLLKYQHGSNYSVLSSSPEPNSVPQPPPVLNDVNDANDGAEENSLLNVKTPIIKDFRYFAEAYNEPGDTMRSDSFGNSKVNAGQNANYSLESQDTEASHFSVGDSFLALAYENGVFLTKNGTKLTFNEKDGTLRNARNEPADRVTGAAVPFATAERFRLDITGNNLIPLSGPPAQNDVEASRSEIDHPEPTPFNNPDGSEPTDDAASAGSISLRHEPASRKPFKKLDFIDRHFINMHEHTGLVVLSMVFLVGIIPTVWAHIRHGRDYAGSFARDVSVGSPSSKGLYFQDKQSDKSRSLRHAMRAAVGSPKIYNVDRDGELDEGEDWDKAWIRDNYMIPESIVNLLKYNRSEHVNNYHWMKRQASSRAEARTAFEERLDEALDDLHSNEAHFALVCIGKGDHNRWVTFRKCSDDDDNPYWTLVDARRYIIDSSNGYQPNIDPDVYLKDLFHGGKLDSFKIYCNGARPSDQLAQGGQSAQVGPIEEEGDNTNF